MNLRFIQLHAIPVHIHHKSSTGNQSLHTSCDPGIRKSRKQMYSSVMALQQHFSHTGSIAKVAVNLERRMGSHAGVMEFNGDVYSCDHFVFPEYKLGNIYQQTLVEMMYSERQQRFGQNKFDSLPRQCKECEWLFTCNGDCPKNRFARTADGEPGLNYLCAGYRKFFSHVAPYMDFMKKEYLAQRAPANVMDAIREGKLPMPR